MNGLYLDIFDLAARVPTVNRKILEQLVRAGAFDSISTDRGLYFENVSQALQAAQTVAASVGQGSLFADENGEAERIVSWKNSYRKLKRLVSVSPVTFLPSTKRKRNILRRPIKSSQTAGRTLRSRGL